MNSNTLPKPPAQPSVDEPTSITKRSSENDTVFTLPNPAGKPSSNLHQVGFPNGSVMWDGPEPSGEGARSAVPRIPPMKTVNPAQGVTDPLLAMPATVSGAAFATADTQPVQPDISQSVQPSSSTTRRLNTPPTHGVIESDVNERRVDEKLACANDDIFANDIDTLHARQHSAQALVQHPGLGKWSDHLLQKAQGLLDSGRAEDPDIQAFEALLEAATRRPKPAAAHEDQDNAGSEERIEEPSVDDRPISENERQEAFGIIQSVRSVIKEIVETRALRKDTEPGATTLADYQKRLHYLQPLFEYSVSQSSQVPWVDTFDMLNVARSTFSQYRSAVKWHSSSRLQTLLTEQDQFQRSLGHSRAWYWAVKTLQEALWEHQEICALSYDEERGQEHWPPSRLKKEHPGKSKKLALKKLPDGWQERFDFFNEQSPTYRYAGVLLRFCGLRPAELERGVQVQWNAEGVHVRIEGAKVRTTAGQPWRSFLLNPAMLPAWFVDELKWQGQMHISANSDSMRSHLGRLSTAVLNPEQRKNGCQENLSAYLFRHALVTQMRESGWESDEIAAAIGESSAETTRLYGLRVRGGKKPKVPIAMEKNSVAAARAVKSADTQGLQKWKNRKPEKLTKLG